MFIRALADIVAGDELSVDYLLDVKGRRTAAIKKLHACRCGAQHCRGTMLAPPEGGQGFLAVVAPFPNSNAQLRTAGVGGKD